MADKTAAQHLKEFFKVYPNYSYSVAELRTIFGISQKEKSAFKKLLQSLVKEGFLTWSNDKKYQLDPTFTAANQLAKQKPQSKQVDKTSQAKPAQGSHSRPSAEPEELRGRIFQDDKMWRVQQAGMHQPSFLLPRDIAPYEEGDKIIFKMVGGEHAEIIAKLQSDITFEDVKAKFLKDNELKPIFPRAVREQVDPVELPVFDPESKRRDFRDVLTLCIDPFGARDHDDAISLEKKGNLWELGVHIADVSHYVREGTPLDHEALKRSFTQYLPWQAVHMLPEKLSSNLCSLKVGQERLAFSCIVQLSAAGVVKDFEFCKSYVKVDEFYTYEEAMELAEAKPRHPLSRLRKVTRLLNDRRKKAGLLLLDLPETKVSFDSFGEPEGLEQKSHIESMNWIEECMLLANQCCAQFLKKKDIPGVFREHGFPKEEDVRELASSEPDLFQGAGGLDQYFKKNSDPDSNVHEGLFELFHILVNNAAGDLNKTRKVLRTMQKADYKPDGNGHFALRWQDYAHFTSPIRRYADLVVHRQMSAFLDKTKLPHTDDEMDEIASKISSREIDVMKLERRGVKFCGAWMAQDYLGDELDGKISGMQDFGLFVEIPGMGFEGLVKYRTMPGDYYLYNEEKGFVYGRRTGRRIYQGDEIRIVVSKVNIMKGEVDFECVRLGDDTHVESSSQDSNRRSGSRSSSRSTSRSSDSKPGSSARRGQSQTRDRSGRRPGTRTSRGERNAPPSTNQGRFSEDGSGGENFNPWDLARKKSKSSDQDDQIIQIKEASKKSEDPVDTIEDYKQGFEDSPKRSSRKLKDNPNKFENSWGEAPKSKKKPKKSNKSADATLKMLDDELAIFDEILADESPAGRKAKGSRSAHKSGSKSKAPEGDARDTWRRKGSSKKSNPSKGSFKKSSKKKPKS